MTKHHGLEGLRTLDLNLQIEKTEALKKDDYQISLMAANIYILNNQIVIMQALVDIINEMQKPLTPTFGKC